nr:hypothetical protein [Tanacetum cinerariifolium]
MLNHDSSIIPSSLKIDSLLDEFVSELTLLKSIPSGIDETDCYLEEDIRLIERLLYDNSSPCPPKEFVSENSNVDIESFSPSPILVEDNDSRMEEIDLSFNPDEPMPSSIEEDDDDSKRDILIHEELLDNYSLSLPVNESFHFDIPSFSHPPAKPPDGNTGILNIKMMGVISDQKICESNSHYGYECSQRVSLIYEPKQCYIQNFSDDDYSHDLPGVNPLIDHHCCYECGNSLNDFFCYQCTFEFYGNGAHVGYNYPAQVPSFQTLPSFPQQYPCCKDCGVLPEADHFQPPQYSFNHPIFNAHNDLLGSGITLMEQMEQLTSMCEMFCQFIQKKQEEKLIKEEQTAKAQNSKILVCYDDDDDYNSAIIPNEPVDSLSMRDEHLNTIPATESDKFIKSCVENLV